MKFELTESEAMIVEGLKNEGNVWVVGGAVRDVFLGKTPKDLDLCTDLAPDTIESIVNGRGFIILPIPKAKEHGIVRVVDKTTGEPIDIATLRRDVSCDGRHAEIRFTKDINEDLARRDFTINAMALPISASGKTGEIVDNYNGRDDIENKLIRFVGKAEDRVAEDYLRMVRACRFTALDDGWRIVPDSHRAIDKIPEGIDGVSKERIRDEILKAISYDKPSNFFRALATTGLLALIFPDLAKGIGCEQNEHHAEPVFDHLLRCLDASADLTTNKLLRLSALTHDVAKPHTRSVDDRGGVHFYKHEVEGASVMYRWMREYKFSKKDIEYVTKMIRHHQWRFEDNTKEKTIRRWLQAVGRDHWKDLITLRCADRKGNLKKANKPMITQKMRELIEIAENIISSGAAIFKEDLAINGDDIKNLGVPPGKIYKEIFSNLLGIVINDPSKNNKEWLSSYISKNHVK